MFAALLLVFTGVITSARFRLLLEALLLLPAALAVSRLTALAVVRERRIDSPNAEATALRRAA
jgi:hypothetical protein